MASVALPRKVLLGGGMRREVGALLQSLALRAPLFVCDPFQAPRGLKDIVQNLQTTKYDVFTDIVPDPTTESVDQCLRKIKSGTYDSVVAVGGGSALDTAKAAAVLAVHGGHMRDYKAPRVFDTPGLPLVCVPTTAGTGSEATKFTIVTDSATDEKMLCVGLAYLPIAAVVDYELTLTAPYRLTADTGIDAFCHAMESYVSKKRNAFSDGLALTAINRIAKSLRVACAEPDNRQAREAMMLASFEAGVSFSNSSVTLIHGMSRPIGALYHVPHGLSNAMLAPAVTEFSVAGAVERYAQVARAADFASLTSSNEDAASQMATGLRQLCKDVGVLSLSQFGVKREAFLAAVPKMATAALGSGSPNNNPRVPTASEIEKLYRDIYDAGVPADSGAAR